MVATKCTLIFAAVVSAATPETIFGRNLRIGDDDSGLNCTHGLDITSSRYPPSAQGMRTFFNDYIDCTNEISNNTLKMSLAYRGPLSEDQAIWVSSDESVIAQDQVVPSGSVTKNFVGVALLNVVRRHNNVTLHDTAFPYVEQVLQRDFNTSLREIYSPEDYMMIQNVTLLQLATMTSGMRDYDDVAMLNATVEGLAPSPLDYIENAAKLPGGAFSFEPAVCQAYSSINFVFLGFVLSELSGAKSSADLKLLDLALESAPPQVKKEFNNTLFAMDGRTCRDYGMTSDGQRNKVVHQRINYDSDLIDFLDYSCWNGGTMGNIMISTDNLVSWFYHLFDKGDILPYSSELELMRQSQLDFYPQCPDMWNVEYGFATILQQFPSNLNETGVIHGYKAVGHPGMDWGSQVLPNTYQFADGTKFSVAVSITDQGLIRMTAEDVLRLNDLENQVINGIYHLIHHANLK